jgi:hypothetical protein
LVTQQPGDGTYAWAQPEAAAQLSAVQALLSSHDTGAPGWHAPTEQASGAVQALPSVHADVLSACWQAFATQRSSVQVLASLQSAAALQQPWTPAFEQTPDVQTSVVQGLLSSHSALLLQAVVKVHRGPVVVETPSDTSAYHS